MYNSWLVRALRQDLLDLLIALLRSSSKAITVPPTSRQLHTESCSNIHLGAWLPLSALLQMCCCPPDNMPPKDIRLIKVSGPNFVMYSCILQFLDCKQVYLFINDCCYIVAHGGLTVCPEPFYVTSSVHMRPVEQSSSSTAAALFSSTELRGKKFSGCKIRSQLQSWI